MVAWSEFAAASPKFAAYVEERMEVPGLALVGTLRADGYPRISPVEPMLFEGQLYLGMMWQSTKALDLLRDPRCLVHTVVANKNGTEGEGKLYGVARSVEDEDERRAYAAAFKAKMGYFPDGQPFHLFALDIEQAGSVLVRDEKMRTRRWRPGDGEAEEIVRD